jgi:outer membrane protein TolC
VKTLLLLAALGADGAQPITLDEALAAAARQNLEVQVARVQRDTSRADKMASYAGVLPRLDLDATWSRTRSGQRQLEREFVLDTGQAFRVVGARSTSQYQLGLRLEQTLFDGLRAWHQIGKAQADLDAAERGFGEAALATAFEVTRRFYEVVKAERSLTVLEETVRLSEEVFRRSEALFTAGRAPKSDTYAARVNLGNDRINVEGQRARVAQARADLSVALGRPAQPPLQAVPPADLDRGLPAGGEPPEADALMAKARASRPFLSQRQAQVASAEEGVRLARGEWWPTLNASVRYGREGSELTGEYGVYGDPSLQYAVSGQLILRWNLFDGQRTRANQQKAALSRERAQLEAGQAEQQVSGEIARTREAVVALTRAASLAQDNLAAAEQGVRLAKDRFDAGAAQQLEVRDALLKLTQARLSLLNTRIDLAVARADLSRAIGG